MAYPYEGWLVRNVEYETFTTKKKTVFQSALPLKDAVAYRKNRNRLKARNAFIYHSPRAPTPKLVEQVASLGTPPPPGPPSDEQLRLAATITTRAPRAALKSSMTVYELNREQLLPVPTGEAFAFFADAPNLEAITPPWLHFRMVTPQPIVMGLGTLIDYRLRLHAVPLRWLTRIELWEPGRGFADVQMRGPYRLWHHTHSFSSRRGGTMMRDVVRYALPFGPLGRVARAALVRRDLDRIFDFRREAVAARLGSK
jgi:hypothetical protein